MTSDIWYGTSSYKCVLPYYSQNSRKEWNGCFFSLISLDQKEFFWVFWKDLVAAITVTTLLKRVSCRLKNRLLLLFWNNANELAVLCCIYHRTCLPNYHWCCLYHIHDVYRYHGIYLTAIKNTWSLSWLLTYRLIVKTIWSVGLFYWIDTLKCIINPV